jgi:ligand-binding sensor domain-containing protein
VWGAVARCGAVRFDPATSQWAEYYLTRENQGPMTMDGEGTLYILGTDGLYVYSPVLSEWRLVATLQAATIAADRQSGVWIGLQGTGELWRFRNGQIERWGQPFRRFSLWRLFVDNRNRLWAVVSGGLKIFDGQTWQPVALALGAIRELTSSPDGRVWVLGSSGVAVYDPAKDKLP